MIENWKNETNKLTLFENLRLYYKIFNEHCQIDDYRWEKLDFLKKNIKKKLPTFIISSDIWFYGVEKYGMFNTSYFQEEDEFYFESLIRWRENNADDFLRRNWKFIGKNWKTNKKNNKILRYYFFIDRSVIVK